MEDLTNESVYNLAKRINQIEYEIRQLEMEYNTILSELHRRLPNLKDDKNLQPKVLRKIYKETEESCEKDICD